jgi:hypothetical protein
MTATATRDRWAATPDASCVVTLLQVAKGCKASRAGILYRAAKAAAKSTKAPSKASNLDVISRPSFVILHHRRRKLRFQLLGGAGDACRFQLLSELLLDFNLVRIGQVRKTKPYTRWGREHGHPPGAYHPGPRRFDCLDRNCTAVEDRILQLIILALLAFEQRALGYRIHGSVFPAAGRNAIDARNEPSSRSGARGQGPRTEFPGCC